MNKSCSQICIVKNCDKMKHCRGYCDKHYSRLLKTGTVELQKVPNRRNEKCIHCDNKIGKLGCISKKLCNRHYTSLKEHNDVFFSDNYIKNRKNKALSGCKVEECNTKHFASGYCNMHYQRLYKRGTVELPEYLKDQKCKYCNRTCKYGHGSLQLCSAHHKSYLKYGDALAIDIARKTISNFTHFGACCELKTPYINKDGYYIDHSGRVRYRNIMEKKLNRKLRKGEVVHHIDHDKQNDNIENLHLCKNPSEHHKIHGQFNKIIPELFKLGIVIFEEGKYKINDKLAKCIETLKED